MKKLLMLLVQKFWQSLSILEQQLPDWLTKLQVTTIFGKYIGKGAQDPLRVAV
jgi:uncharacterized protein involved in cysteine biosynthesis